MAKSIARRSLQSDLDEQLAPGQNQQVSHDNPANFVLAADEKATRCHSRSDRHSNLYA